MSSSHRNKETRLCKQVSANKWFLNLTFLDPCIIVKFIKKNPTRCNNVSNFINPYLYEAQHVSGDTPPIIRSLKLHWQPLVFHTWKIVCTCSWWMLSGTLCLTTSTSQISRQSAHESGKVVSPNYRPPLPPHPPGNIPCNHFY